MWKELKEFIDYMEDKTSKELTKEEKKDLISEIEAKNKAKEILKKFDYKNEEINLFLLLLVFSDSVGG